MGFMSRTFVNEYEGSVGNPCSLCAYQSNLKIGVLENEVIIPASSNVRAEVITSRFAGNVLPAHTDCMLSQLGLGVLDVNMSKAMWLIRAISPRRLPDPKENGQCIPCHSGGRGSPCFINEKSEAQRRGGFSRDTQPAGCRTRAAPAKTGSLWGPGVAGLRACRGQFSWQPFHSFFFLLFFYFII